MFAIGERPMMVLIFVLPMLLGSCAGGDTTPEGGNDSGTTADAGEVSGAGGGGTGDGPTGTFVIDGTAVEASGLESSFRGTTGDFRVCTFSDGGDEGHVTVHVDLSETDLLFLSFGRADGLSPSADYPSAAESTDDVVAELDGDVAVGTATWDDGTVIEFEVRC